MPLLQSPMKKIDIPIGLMLSTELAATKTTNYLSLAVVKN